jgi:drug/metabolite transporter (DMT)-like permease
MELTVFVMVIAAALLHAVWNAIVKIQGDRLVIMAIVSGSSGLLSLFALPFVAFPTIESWPYICVSIVLHNAYYLALIVSYRFGDLSLVYPIARGISPLVVTLISVLLLGEHITSIGLFAVALISIGLIALVDARAQSFDWRAVAAAVATGLLIALYTVTDGLGVRVATDPNSYTFWLFFLDGFPLVLVVALYKRQETLRIMRTNWVPGILAGVVSLFAIWIIMWALALAPMAYVSALRETSTVFAIVIGVVFLKEHLDLRRLVAVFCAMAGSLLLKISR